MKATRPKDGEFYYTRTLLGSVKIDETTGKARMQDINKRTIYRWPSDKPVLELNTDFKEWTAEDEADLRRRLDDLNRGGRA